MQRIAHLLLCLTLAGCNGTALPVATKPAGPTAVTQQSAPEAALNARRAAQGKSAVTRNLRLDSAAMAHARDLARSGRFSHESTDGSQLSDRVRGAGYSFCFVAENIAEGQDSIEEVMSGWMNSPGHRRNMLSENARDFGFARQGNLWVLVLGRSGC